MINPGNNEIKAVIFDLGRVLVKVDFARGLFKYAHPSPNADDLTLLDKLFKNELFIKYNTGKIDTKQMYQSAKDQFDIQLEYDVFIEKWCDIFEPMEGMESVVREIQGKYPIGLLSDIDPAHWNYLKKNYPLLDVFENPTLSFETGILKPAVEVYKIAAKNIGFDPENCFFIDDRPQNIEGAVKAGMRGVIFTGVEKLRTDLQKAGIL